MRILTVRQPWAWAIIHGGKDVENRTRNIAGGYRGPVAIHAASREATPYNEVAAEIFDRSGTYVLKAPMSAIIGVVDLVDVHHDSDTQRCPDHARGRITCSPWSQHARHHLVLTNPRAFATPIPAKGRLGLWRPDPTLHVQIETALAAVGDAS